MCHTSEIVIDFGGATYDNDPRKSRVINTRQYRGPEVILELGWSFPSDLWSVGCIIGEIYRGDLFFQTVRSVMLSPMGERYKTCSDGIHVCAA